MKFLSWAIFCEGTSDAAYLEILIPKLIREIISQRGTQIIEISDYPSVRFGSNGREINIIAKETCAAKEAFEIIFIHSDTGGRALESEVASRSCSYCSRMNELCGLESERCVTVIPRHEIEAWVISDGYAVVKTLGFTGSPKDIGLPNNAHEAERSLDPKAALKAAIKQIAGKRRARQEVANFFPAIAQRQNLDILRGSRSFIEFEERLESSLSQLRYL